MTFAASSGPLVLIYYHFEYLQVFLEYISTEGKYAYPAITPFSFNVFQRYKQT